jgi:hypothetical protein
MEKGMDADGADFTAQRADMESAPASGLWFSCNMSGWIFGYRQILIKPHQRADMESAPNKAKPPPQMQGWFG